MSTEDRKTDPTGSRAADTARRPPGPNGRDTADTRSPAEIRRDIQETRADLDAAVDELEARLRPKRLAWEARRRVEPAVRRWGTKAKTESLRASQRARTEAEDHKEILFVALGALAGLWLIKTLWSRRRRDPFPDEQRGI